MEIIDYAVLGFGFVGACYVGHTTAKIAEERGLTPMQGFAMQGLAVGLSVAVLPVTAITGAAVTLNAGIEAYKARDELRSEISARWNKARGTKPQGVAA